MAIEGPDNNGAPVPPGGFPPPPPPPPPQGGNAPLPSPQGGPTQRGGPAPLKKTVTWDAETLADIEEAKRLRPLAEEGNKEALNALRALQKKYGAKLYPLREKLVNEPERHLRDVIKAQLQELKAKLPTMVDGNLTAKGTIKVAFDAKERQLKLDVATLEEQQHTVHEKQKAKVEEALAKKLLELNALPKECEAQIADIERQVKALEKDIAAREKAIFAAKREVKPYEELMKNFEIPKAKSSAVVARPPVNVKEWILGKEVKGQKIQGFLQGIFLINLRDFIIQERELDQPSELAKYEKPVFIAGLYDRAAKQEGLTEVEILGIACGYISRPKGIFCSNHNRIMENRHNHKKDFEYDEDMAPALQALIEMAYKFDENLIKDSAVVANAGEGSGASPDMGAVKSLLQARAAHVEKAEHDAPVLVVAPTFSPVPPQAKMKIEVKGKAPSSDKGKAPIQEPVEPACKSLDGKDFRDCLAHEEKAKRVAWENDKKLAADKPSAQHGVPSSFSSHLELLEKREDEIAVLAAELDALKLEASNKKAITQQYEAEKLKAEMLLKALAESKSREGMVKPITPVDILQKKKIAGTRESVELFVKQNGRLPTPEEGNTLGQQAGFRGRDLITFRAAFKTAVTAVQAILKTLKLKA